MYINTVTKYQLHQGYMFRQQSSHHQANAEHIQGTISAHLYCTLYMFCIGLMMAALHH